MIKELIAFFLVFLIIVLLVSKKDNKKSGFIDSKYSEVFDRTNGKITYSDFKVLFPEHIDNVDFYELKNKWKINNI